METSTVGAAATTNVANGSRAVLSQNFDTFLTLLTAQLSNQDPLNPVDSAQFTQQLVQYSQVEQQIQTNEKLASLLDQIRVSNVSSAASFIGRSATIDSNIASLGEGGARWSYDVTGAVGDVEISVLDKAGRVAFKTLMSADRGDKAFTWDGKDAHGRSSPAGLYRLDVKAFDVNGDRVDAAVSVKAKITGIAPTASGYDYVTDLGHAPFKSILAIE